MADVEGVGHGERLLQTAEGARCGCTHPSHRTLRLFISYAEANAVRISLKASARSDRVAVSPLRRVEGGWSFSMCEQCLVAREDEDGREPAA